MSERRLVIDRRRPSGRRAPAPDSALDVPPFLRPERRTRVRRRGALQRAIVVIEATGGCLVAALVIWGGYVRVMASDRLKVAHLEVHGSHFLSEGEVRELLGPAKGENILSLDIEALKARLRESPWVAEASVTRALPDTLRVDVRERVPLALAEVDLLYLMDGDGTLIDLYGPRTSGFDLPIVRGLGGIDGETRREKAQRAGALLSDLGELGAEISELDIEPSGDLKVVLRGRGELLRMGPPPCRQRLLTFLALRAELAKRCPDAEYFDLRFRDRIFAHPRAASSPAEPAGRAPAGARPLPPPAAPATPGQQASAGGGSRETTRPGGMGEITTASLTTHGTGPIEDGR